uniref:uncharacterized protein LOC120807664 n=1 Tax=Gasterosteus aculeatus aculeatus TaxID=481459 RepID=UPI001A995AD4|nr:uncharacterized protein LOC120807664 [Gasterosteus aculeatus aculeatus]
MDNMDTCSQEDQKEMDSDKVWQWRITCGEEISNFNIVSNTDNNSESDLHSGKVTNSGISGNQAYLEASSLGVCESALTTTTTTDKSSSLPIVKESARSLMCQPDERGVGGGEEQRQTPTECDLKQEETGTEKSMWKLRANRVKHILSAEEFGPFNFSRMCGLEFNVGYGKRKTKKNFSVDSSTDNVLLEIAAFALVMNSSQQGFIMEILENNFDLNLKSEFQRNFFTYEMMKRVRHLKECEDSVKFSKEVFKLHGPLPPIRTASQSVNSVNAELSSISKMEESEVACGFPLHSQTEEDISVNSVDLYPFCKEIGLKLHVDNTQPNEKQDINRLTYGAMTEVTNFAEILCGTFEQICVDILKHNFGLDMQCGDSDHVKSMLARISFAKDKRNLNRTRKTKTGIIPSLFDINLNAMTNPNSHALNASSSNAATLNQDVEIQNNHNLWQLRENQIQRILSRPHVEHCPLYSFTRCKKMGIDFNVGSGAQQNIDLKLLTNGIMVELSTFAKEMVSAQYYFVTEILEHNFHLDFNNELNRCAFAQKTLNQIMYMRTIKYNKVPVMKKTFDLSDTKCIPKPSDLRTLYCPKCYQVRNNEHRRDESVSGPILHHHPPQHTMTDAGSADGNSITQKPAKDPSFTFSAIEEIIMDKYPLCKEISLKLLVDKDQPRRKLDLHVLTRGVMREVVSYAKYLCGNKNKIINDVLQHNFNVGALAQQINPFLNLSKPKRQNDLMLAWLDEAFDIQPYARKQPGHGSEWKEMIKKRTLPVETQEKTARTTPRRKVSRFSTLTENGLTSGESEKLNLKPTTKYIGDMEQEEIGPENCYTRPLEESDIESDEVTDSENSMNQDHLQKPKSYSLSSDVCRESEASCLGVHASSLTTDVSSSLPILKARVKSQMCEPDEQGLGGGEEQTPTPTECVVERDEMEIEDNMWKMRANRVKQILSAEEFGSFVWSKKHGFQFNVGYEPKQNFSVDSLLDYILLEIAEFALAMNSSQQDFIMEILEYNFDLNLKSEPQRNLFTCEMMKRVRHLKECEDSVKFSKEVFKLHGPLPPIRTASQSVNSVNAELSSISKMEESEVAYGFPLHSQAETEENISLNSMDLYPFCKEIGLKLHVDNTQPNEKQDINRLTYGAMTEVTNFAESLCGTFEQICVDILKHNLDLDLQCGGSDYVKSMLARIPFANHKRKLRATKKSYMRGRNHRFYQIARNPNLHSCAAGSSNAIIINQDMGNHKNLKLKLWQLRKNQIQRILSRPHLEHCPLYSYSGCKNLGIDFNVGSGVKQNLDPKLLTNGIMVELLTFATEMVSAQRYFITEILEHNFHLDFNNELNRIAFAQKTIDQIMYMRTKKSNKVPVMKKTFDLPDTNCIPEPYHLRTSSCPYCYEELLRNEHRRDESVSGAIHHPPQSTMIDAGSADENSTTQKSDKEPSSTLSAIEEKMMDIHPFCKEIRLNLLFDKDQPIDKLDPHLLTYKVMRELVCYSNELSGGKHGLINDILQHNFNIDELYLFGFDARLKSQKDVGLTWLNEVFDIRPSQQPAYGSDLTGTMKKSKMAVKTLGKPPRTTPRRKVSRECGDIKSSVAQFPALREKNAMNASMIKGCQTNVKLASQNEPNSDAANAGPKGCVDRQATYFSDVYNLHFVDRDKVNEKLLSPNEDTQYPTDPGTVVQTDEQLLGTRCDSPLWVKLEIKEEEYDPRYGSTTPEPDPEPQRCPLHDVKSEN